MKTFRRYYIEAIALWVYFYFLLPWGLSQPSNLVTTGSFISLAVVVYLIIGEIIKTLKEKNIL